MRPTVTEPTPLQLAIRLAISRSGKTRDHWDRQLQARLGTKGKPLYDIDRGKSKSPSMDTIEAIAEVFGLPVAFFLSGGEQRFEDVARGHGGLPVSEHTPTRTADGGDTATVMRMDLSYAMGPGTNIDEDYIEGEPVELDIGFLRRLTPSAPSMLRIVNGIGDSMQPTIHDSEELILDLGQRKLNLQDRIWAMSLYGVGAVKRLKAIGQGRILVISDNPDVPDQEVDSENLMLVGRIVGSIRRH